MAPKVPASSRSQVSPADALNIGAQLSALSAYSMSKEPASTGPFRSSGRVVFRLMVPPSAPSTISGVGDLITSTEERKLAGKSSKLMPFRPPPTRSEERRVGKECRCGGGEDHQQDKQGE